MADEVVEETRRRFGRAAAGWERWGDLLGQRDDASLYLEAARIRPGQRVLEIGAGTGEQTLAIARRVGPEGQVVATDLTGEMLAVARRRAEDAGLDNVTFGIADATRLEEFDAGEFDAAVSGFTWLFLPDPVASASAVRAMLRPGAWFAASVWSPMPQVPMVSVALQAAIVELGVEPPARGVEGAPDLSDPTTFAATLRDAGFGDVTVAPFEFTLRWSSAQEYGAWVRDVFVDLADLIDGAAPDRAEDVYDAVVGAAAEHAAGDGSVTFTNVALLGAGARAD